jgi:hypothetical protein
MLYILSNNTNEKCDLTLLPEPDIVVFVVFSNKPKNKTTINEYGKYCSRNNIAFNICYIVGENYNPTIACLNGIGSMYGKGTVMVL